MAKRAAKERVAALKHDTDRLLKLSVELKQSVDKSDENVLSLDVIKKAEEIEKAGPQRERQNERPELTSIPQMLPTLGKRNSSPPN